MNINNVSGPVEPNRPVEERSRSAEIEARQAQAEGQARRTAESRRTEREGQIRLSREARLIDEQTRAVEEMQENPPRRELVAKARERVENGNYNKREFVERLAEKIVRAEMQND